MVPINYWAVLLNVVIAMGLGFLWYGPLFGKKWIASMGWTEAQVQEKMKQGMGKSYALMALGALIMSFVLSHSLIFAATYLSVSGIPAGLETGFWNWIGFVAPVLVGGVLWEGKKWMWYVINAGYYLVLLCLMGIILALWK
jgi:hypothetical protein